MSGPAGGAGRANYSFDDGRLDVIERGNSHLLGRLSEIASRPPASAAAASARVASAGSARSSHTINRKKRDAEIERENMLLLRRLQGAKATVNRTGMVASARSRPGSSASGIRGSGGGAGAAAADPLSARSLGSTAGSGAGVAGRPAWVEPTATARPADFGASGGGGGGYEYAAGKTLSPEKAAAAKKSVFGRASLGGTARVAGRVTGVPPPRGGFGAVDVRDLAMAACREDHLTGAGGRRVLP